MKAVLIAFVLLIGGGAAIGASSPRPTTHDATLRLAMEDDGICSGTAVGPHLILTASHCFVGDNDQAVALRSVNGKPAKAEQVWQDDNDHTLMRVSVTFDKWAKLGGKPYQQQRIVYWGNPIGLEDIYRQGYVSGFRAGAALITTNCMLGDSGSALFDDNGYIVGVTSQLAQFDSFQLLVALPITFTAEQKAQAGL